ncbi:DUF4212 domain-containing protein [Herbaspirillum rubrisubalbicans]|uniref:DUF4212 domain-containing protein n=1 Tax=Herbaspirillum rubrisubalbicans Os34 TaxID=1235827 RepID=A0A6M3ZKX8_9BURK|nr:DUF4212 domain-containing protein [Herbaspirillum rubrisubalbicans]MCP1576034.1 putative solute:sodium symporter small subunit [Herbaspirillum rubrisubalbicans]NQE48782.1 sodium:solute symporter [Herbaspirillum rubrisubalbicans]QJP99298.1 DUF4212 domain-containing protein [Herbaspirillum rubrisubalbicans Os34]
MDQAPQPIDPGNQWHRTRRMTAWLLALWFAATFCFIYFARELDRVHLFGWPVSFYMAAQGMMLIYLAIVVIYVRRMRRIEQLVRREQGESGHGE